MVLERAVIKVADGRQDAFEAAFIEARAVIESSPGCRSARLHRGVENPEQFLLLVEWDRLEDHLVGFRQSEHFTEWRAIIGPFFAQPPEVDHYQPVGQVAAPPN
jgi:heme-degrading monooxygenase HmoA